MNEDLSQPFKKLGCVAQRLSQRVRVKRAWRRGPDKRTFICTGNNSSRYSKPAYGPNPQSGWRWQALRLGLERVFQRDRFGVRMEVTRQGYDWQPQRFFLVVVVVGVVALQGDTLGDINGNTGSRLVPVQSLG
jgi:hypothetical protein